MGGFQSGSGKWVTRNMSWMNRLDGQDCATFFAAPPDIQCQIPEFTVAAVSLPAARVSQETYKYEQMDSRVSVANSIG